MNGADAIRALHATGALRNLNVTVVMKREEEYPGDPRVEARAALVDAAKLSNLALAFEGASRTSATIGRRSTSDWTINVTGHQDQQHRAGDLSFVAPSIDGVERLGAPGTEAHPPSESVNPPELTMQTERAALMLCTSSPDESRHARRAACPANSAFQLWRARGWPRSTRINSRFHLPPNQRRRQSRR